MEGTVTISIRDYEQLKIASELYENPDPKIMYSVAWWQGERYYVKYPIDKKIEELGADLKKANELRISLDTINNDLHKQLAELKNKTFFQKLFGS